MSPPIRVLVVEDSPVERELMRQLLQEDPGIQVVGMAASGEEAVEEAQRLEPDVITMDVVLPGMDGIECTRRILKQVATRILVVTGYADQEHLNLAFEALSAGAVDVLSKPMLSDREGQRALRERLKAVASQVLGRESAERSQDQGQAKEALSFLMGRGRRATARILVVEDSPTQRKRTASILESAGYRVGTAAEGGEALELIRAHPPDLVITDIVMPGMDGLELCRTIRDRPQTHDLPVVLLTGLTGVPDILSGLQVGADNFITKPFRPDFLLSRVESILTNLDLRRRSKLEVEVEMELLGQRVEITADKQQIFELLLSTFGELVEARDELQSLAERQTRRLGELTQLSSSLLDPQSVLLDRALATGCRLLRARLGALQLLDEEGRVREFRWAGPGEEAMRSVSAPPSGRGIMDLTLEPGRALRMRDLDEDPAAYGFPPGQPSLGSLIVAPITMRQRTLGRLYFAQKADAEAFTDEDEALLLALAGMVGSSLDAALLLEEQRRRLKELETQAQVAARLNASSDLGEILPAALRTLLETLAMASGEIWLLDASDRSLKLRSRVGRLPEPFHSVENLGPGQGLPGWVVQKRQAVLSSALPDDLRGFARELAAAGVSVFGCLPIEARGEVVGALTVGAERARQLSQAEVVLLESVADLLGTAFQRAEILQELRAAQRGLQRYAAELEERVEERTRELQEAHAQLLVAERQATLVQVAATLAHEMRHPLAVMSNAVYLIVGRLAGDESLSRYRDILEGEVARMNRHLTTLLEFTEPREPQLEEVSLRALVREALEEAPAPPGVRVVTRWGRVSRLQTDPAHLTSALCRILQNAYEAMPQGGEVTLGARRRRGWIELDVRDTGVGMPPQHMSRIFEPLFSTKTFGMGLGLPTTRAIVEGLGGEILVHSEVGQGTTVTLRLPTRPPAGD